MNKLVFIICFCVTITFCSCGKKTSLEGELQGENEATKLNSSNLQEVQEGSSTSSFPNVRIKPDSTWEDADLNDFPERLRVQIESDVKESKNRSK